MTASTSKGENTAKVMHRPDWHPVLSMILGSSAIVDSYAYVTPYNTIHLLGPLWKSPNLSKASFESNQSTPTQIFSAEGGLGF